LAETTGISWTDATWNPWQGCTKVSPGCKNCYAETLSQRWGKDFSQLRRSAPRTFNAPLRWKEPKLIFTCSMSDFFHPDADEWRQDAMAVIKATPWHTYQILTKRPEEMLEYATWHGWPDNAWAGVSVESQQYAPRLDVLARVPAQVRFVSVEPMLGPVDLRPWLWCQDCLTQGWMSAQGKPCGRLQWIIAGGESGPGHRVMDLAELENLGRQCSMAETPLWVKQDSGLYPGRQGRIPDSLWARKEMP